MDAKLVRLDDMKRQWRKWTLPSKWGVIGGILAIPAVILTIIAWVWPSFWQHSSPAQAQAPIQQITTGEGSAAIVGNHNTVSTGTKQKDQTK